MKKFAEMLCMGWKQNDENLGRRHETATRLCPEAADGASQSIIIFFFD